MCIPVLRLLLLQYISLNMKAIRKILKKYAKNVEPTKPTPGFMTLGARRMIAQHAPALGRCNTCAPPADC